MSSRGILLHVFYGQSRDKYSPWVYLYTSIMSLSFDDMKVRGEEVSLVGWHHRNSSSQGPYSSLF